MLCGNALADLLRRSNTALIALHGPSARCGWPRARSRTRRPGRAFPRPASAAVRDRRVVPARQPVPRPVDHQRSLPRDSSLQRAESLGRRVGRASRHFGISITDDGSRCQLSDERGTSVSSADVAQILSDAAPAPAASPPDALQTLTRLLVVLAATIAASRRWFPPRRPPPPVERLGRSIYTESLFEKSGGPRCGAFVRASPSPGPLPEGEGDLSILCTMPDTVKHWLADRTQTVRLLRHPQGLRPGGEDDRPDQSVDRAARFRRAGAGPPGGRSTPSRAARTATP